MKRSKKFMSILLTFGLAISIFSVPGTAEAAGTHEKIEIVRPRLLAAIEEPAALAEPAYETIETFAEGSPEEDAEEQKYSETELLQILERRILAALEEERDQIDVADLEIPNTDTTYAKESVYSPYLKGIRVGVATGYDTEKSIYRWFSVDNTMEAEDTKAYFQKIDSEVEKITTLLESASSDEEKILFLHDYLVHEYEYDYENYLIWQEEGSLPSDHDSFKSGGLLMNEKGICNAYAYAFKYFMDKEGIECYFVESNDMQHAWNIVKLDGSYYHVDCTHDDPVRDMTGKVSHKNFLLSDEAMRARGYTGWDEGVTCDDKKYDDAFWQDAVSQIIVKDGSAYYVKCTDPENPVSSICKRDLSDGTETPIKNDLWYSGLFLYKDVLYFNTLDEVRRIPLDGNEKDEVFYQDAGMAGKYCYGCRKHGDELQLQFYDEGELLKTSVPFPRVKAQKITLSASELQMKVGEEITLTYFLTPVDADSDVTWSSSDQQVATVANGVIKALSKGTTVVTAQAEDGIKADCTVTVEEVQLPPEKAPTLSLDKTELTLLKKTAKDTLTVTAAGENADKLTDWTWTSSDPSVSVAIVQPDPKDPNAKIDPKKATVTSALLERQPKDVKVTVSAKFGEETVSAECTVKVDNWYADIPHDFWPEEGQEKLESSLKGVSDPGWMEGYLTTEYEDGKTRFGLNANLLRYQFALIVYRMAGSPAVDESAQNPFMDVTERTVPSEEARTAILWAQKEGVINGYDPTRFGPNDKITRAQMMVMMYRYATKVEKLATDPSEFSDLSQFGSEVNEIQNDEMKEAIQWCVGREIVGGVTENGVLKLRPQGSAKREQCAIVVAGFAKVFDEAE